MSLQYIVFTLIVVVLTELGQIGTQFDGLGHIGVQTSQGNSKIGIA
ncbi:hypothetical protein [Coleofasciculus sp. F4-SAH-05]